MSFTTAALIATWAALLVLALAIAGILRQLRWLAAGGVQPRLQVGPAIGAPAPPLPAEAPLEPPALLLFADRDCEGCAEIVPAFANGHGEGFSKAVLYAGDALGGANGVLVLGNQRAVFEHWNVQVTPFCAVVDHDGRVAAAGPVGSVAVLEGLITAVERRIGAQRI